jgi:hypothetical protein
MINYPNFIVNESSGWNVLADVILGDQLDIAEWLMDTYNITTHNKSPLHYAIKNRNGTFHIARWLLNSRRSSNADLQTEFADTIKYTLWKQATLLIEIGKIDIDKEYLWKSVYWPAIAKNYSEDVKLFLRALLPRVDFPLYVSDILMNTPLHDEDGTEFHLHRQLVLDGMRVREKVKTFYKSRTQVVEKLKLPNDVKKFNILNSFLSDEQVDMTTEQMWASILS